MLFINIEEAVIVYENSGLFPLIWYLQKDALYSRQATNGNFVPVDLIWYYHLSLGDLEVCILEMREAKLIHLF